MGKGAMGGKKKVLAFSKSRMPQDLNESPAKKMTFKDAKRASILSGLRMMRAPAVVLMLVSMIFSLPLQWGPAFELDHLELFAGDCSVTLGEFKEGRSQSIAMDIRHDPKTMDLMDPRGFISACYHATCLKPGSGFLAAPVCLSFVFMNSGTARRTDARPLGEEAFESVWMGNVLCARTLIVLLIAHSLECWWILEQPKGSKMEAHPCFQDVLRWIHVWRQHISMGAFGAKSLKPTWLYSSSEAIEELAEFSQPFDRDERIALVEHYHDASGKSRIKGNQMLKGSQSYPRGFGRALSKLRTRHGKRLRSAAKNLILKNAREFKQIPKNTRKNRLWEKCAHLKPIFEYLS